MRVKLALMLAAIAIVAVAVIPHFMEHNERGEYFTMVVDGNSMYPTFYDGQEVTVENSMRQAFNVSVGDVIVFWDENVQKYVMHRVIAITVTDGVVYYITKGDNNEYEDAPVKYSAVIGKVVS